MTNPNADQNTRPATHIAVIGASGAIGAEFVNQLATMPQVEKIHAFSRSTTHFNSPKVITGHCDLTDETAIQSAGEQTAEHGPLDMVIIASGILSDQDYTPEKSLRDLSARQFQHIFNINTFGPALVMKHFTKHLNRESRTVLAALSARVGSISDNRLGGWYSYRASKAALNMIIRNVSIESKRKNKQSIVIGLHPGTVDSNLSKPFQTNVPDKQLFTPQHSVSQMLNVIHHLTPEDTGKCFAYDGEEITP